MLHSTESIIPHSLLTQGQKFTLECILKLVACLQRLDHDLEDAMLNRVIQAMCHIPHEQLVTSATARNDDDEESFSASEFLVFLRQYVYHLRLRISNRERARKPPQTQTKDASSHGALCDDDEKRDQRKKHANGKPDVGKSRRRSQKEDEQSGDDAKMPIPVTRKNTLPPIF